MKKGSILLAAAAAALLVLVSQVARAGGGDGVHGHLARLLHGGPVAAQAAEEHLERMAAQLELDAAQRKQVAAILTGALPELETRVAELAAAHAAQFQAVHAARFDEAAIRSASLRTGAAGGDCAVAVGRLLRDVHAVLTSEQLARAAECHPLDPLAWVSEHVREAGRGARIWAGRQ